MSRPVIDVVREYANAKGCVLLDGQRFVSRDGKRSIRFVEAKYGKVTVWDTGVSIGYVSLSRERRDIKSNTLKAKQGDALTGARETERPGA